MAMDPSAFSLMFLFLSTLFSAPSVSSSTFPSYSDHCASIVPESTPTAPSTTVFPHLRPVFSHYTGGDRILSNFSSGHKISFRFHPTKRIFKTNTTGVYNIEAYLIFETPEFYHLTQSSTGDGTDFRLKSLRFVLNGFWSEDSRKLCMVGSAPWYSRGGNLINLDAVLKLNYAMNLTVFSSLITGHLESLASPNDPNYFEPVSIMEFGTSSDYQYPLVSGEFDRDCRGGIDIPKNQSLSLGFDPSFLCHKLTRQSQHFNLEYSNECYSSKNCNPLGKNDLPSKMILRATQCSEEEKKVQYLITFGSLYQPFDPSTTLVGEASWDENKNQLCIVACRLLSSTGSLENAHIGDCSIRLSLRYLASWSIRERTNIVGQIWTNKTSDNFGYFHSIAFRSRYTSISSPPGLRYEYTVTDKVREFCPFKKPAAKRRARYPKGDSESLSFFTQTSDSGGLAAQPYFVGDQISWSNYPVRRSTRSMNRRNGPLNVSYTVFPYRFNFSAFVPGKVPPRMFHVSAEGLYDEETGSLCLVGCRKLSTSESMDCEIHLKFQFPPVNAKNGGLIRGTIESMREETDPLHFKQWEWTANPQYSEEDKGTTRLDLSIVMVLITNTLTCIFAGLQILHKKKKPLPFVSLVMLFFPILGHMIPLTLDLKALFSGNQYKDDILLWSGGWVEMNDYFVRAFTLMAFLPQFFLLQLAFSARLRGKSYKVLWIAEKKALFVSTTLHTLGLLSLLYPSTRQNDLGPSLIFSSNPVEHISHGWGDLLTYSGFMLDGFLLPQILFNFFQVSKRRNTLSPSFYIGTTFVRLLPRVYDLSRTRMGPRVLQLYGTYVLAHCYSATWDVVICCALVVFAVVIYLQQRFGGRCIFPRRFREVEVDEKVPLVSSYH